MSLQYLVRGKVMEEGEFLATATKAPPKTSVAALRRVDRRDLAKESDGFAVVGFSPKHLVEAERDRALRIADFDLAESKGQARGMKRPPVWNLEQYMNSAKPKRVRTKPYEIAEAADTCAELARKAGWQRVRVDELLKG